MSTPSEEEITGPNSPLDTNPETAYGWDSAVLDLDSYLERVGYHGALTPSPGTLRALHLAHATSIPFENLELLRGGEVRLDVESLQDKLVRRRRGGYCFEHNLLFAAVLDRLGYKVTGLSARIRMGSNNLRPAAHAMLKVETEGGAWIADVGAGEEGLLEPFPLVDGAQERQGGWTNRLDQAGDGTWTLRLRRQHGWFDLYSFSLEPNYRVDYVVQNHFVATHPSSPFTKTILASRGNKEVGYSLSGLVLTTRRPGRHDERRELTPEELPRLFDEFFGVPLSEDEKRDLLRLASTER